VESVLVRFECRPDLKGIKTGMARAFGGWWWGLNAALI
jgi:hypothetical protein